MFCVDILYEKKLKFWPCCLNFFQTSEIEEICKRIGGNPEEKQIEAASASQLSPSEHPHPHHPHHHHGHHRHHHGHHPHHHPQGHHHRGDHQHLTAINNQPNHRVLGQEPADAAFLAAAVEGPLQGNRLWQRGSGICKHQLSWNWQHLTGPVSSSWCWHCRHLLFEEQQSTASWHCRGELPSSWRWQGQLLADNVAESWQWRLPTAAWLLPAARRGETWQWAGLDNWAWGTV